MLNAEQTTALAGKISPACGIDYSDVEEVCGYQLLLTRIFERAGGFSCPRVTNATVRSVIAEGRVWLREVKSLITAILSTPHSTSHIPHLTSAYDMFYRVCHGEPCPGFLRETRLVAVQRWLKGDRSISDTDVTLMIAEEMESDIRSLHPRYTAFVLKKVEGWIKELNVRGGFAGVPAAESYRRLVYLLRNNLFAYLGGREQDRIKRHWVRAHIVDDPSLLDTPTLLEYIPFVTAAVGCGLLPGVDCDSEYVSLCTELAGRPDLHPFFRAAVECGEVAGTRRAALICPVVVFH